MKSEVHLIDCMEFMRSVPDKFYSLAVVDPPYGIGISSNPVRQMHSKKEWDNSIPSERYFIELFRVSKNQIVWGGNYFGLPASQGFLIWDKKQPEDFSLAMCEYAWSSFQSPAKMLRLSVQSEQNKIHPTQKPVALYDWIFRNYAKPNDAILDTHMGSQSSRISAYKAGLDFTGCELDPEYFEQGNHRFNEFLKKYGTPDPTKAIHGQQINLF